MTDSYFDASVAVGYLSRDAIPPAVRPAVGFSGSEPDVHQPAAFDLPMDYGCAPFDINQYDGAYMEDYFVVDRM